VLQISSYWQPGTPITLDLAPGTDLLAALLKAKATSRRSGANELAALMPSAAGRRLGAAGRRVAAPGGRGQSNKALASGWPTGWRAGHWCPWAPRATARPR
jgi:hypothetical protein